MIFLPCTSLSKLLSDSIIFSLNNFFYSECKKLKQILLAFESLFKKTKKSRKSVSINKNFDF